MHRVDARRLKPFLINKADLRRLKSSRILRVDEEGAGKPAEAGFVL
ncbi:MAG: hypothetical protein N2045_05365 [Fimbriimonadales bacterium]|nr:hypothetical protein [Fimbriimonadales bacterium]